MEALELLQAFGACMYKRFTKLEGEYELTIQGDLIMYNLYDHVWKVELDNAKIKMKMSDIWWSFRAFVLS